MFNLLKITAVAATLAAALPASAATVFVGDSQGNVGAWDTDTNTGTSVGSFASWGNISQIIGLAYDSSRNLIIATDRTARNVLGMDASSGAVNLLFTVTTTFQGAAYYAGSLYGINESTQKLEKYDAVTGVQTILGSATNVNHDHGLGVDAATGQLYGKTSSNDAIFEMGQDGVRGVDVVTDNGNVEDLEYFGGDFLVARFGQTLDLVDGTTGANSTFISSAQIDAMGVTGNLSGVALLAGPTDNVSPIPVPASIPLLLTGFGLMATLRGRRKAA